ncbi:MAG: glutamine--fructose-6-phosphate transaminase (isomerizing) [Gemmatimonadota bacterium]|nr:glutamine--fructose-6-phosphate transaminase (isomerizing) [Gemmatimonadota bacterium]
MCGIVAYSGSAEASPILLEALRRLEYRGYDSAGVVVQNGQGLVARKASGRLAALDALLARDPVAGSAGMGHTRWATHGPPTEANAHPHLDCTGEIAVCHNGIVENADLLRVELQRRGHVFRSETDTEVLAHLIEECWVPPLSLAVRRALSRVEGTYGLTVMSAREPGHVVCARRGSPLLVGLAADACYAASDAAALLPWTRRVVHLDDDEIAVLDAGGCDVLATDDLVRVEKTEECIEWDAAAAEKGGYPHFMLKEIHDQPDSLMATVRGRILPDRTGVRLGGLRDVVEPLARARRVIFVACGTSWHAGLVGRTLVEELAGLQADCEYAAEWRYRKPVVGPDTVVVGISQSGETADTLAAIRQARTLGCTTLGVVNVVGSSIARATDAGIYLHAGPEIGVASTKAFTSQVAALALLALHLGRTRGLDPARTETLLRGLRALPGQVAGLVARSAEIAEIAGRFTAASNFLYLGRGHGYPVALEGALKLKEISYIHAEGFSAAEMKHGPIALIDEGMPVVVVAPRDAVYPKVLANIQEVKARGGRVIAVTTAPNGLAALADHVILVPDADPALMPVLTSIPLQLLAYHLGVARGCDVDKPRNLAKSVTVE